MRILPFLSRIPRLGLLLLALLPAACHLADAPPGKTTLAIDADPNLMLRDSILIILKSSAGPDTLYNGKLKSLDTLSHLPAEGYDGGRALIVIQGYDGGLLVYEERRDYNGTTQKNLDVDVPLDQTGTGHVSSLDIRPDKIRLFVGGTSQAVQATPAETWKDKPLVWTTGEPGVATVSQTGEVSPVGPGVTYVRAVSGDTARDASIVTVVRDVPVIDAGTADTTIQVGASAVFAVKVTQEYGDVAAFAWDLDGDGVFEDSVAGTAGQTIFPTPAHVYATTGEIPIRFRARDVEGNVATAAKKVKVTNSAPRIDSALAAPATVSIKDSVSFSAIASGSGAALRSFAWDFDGDGKADQSGDLAGDRAKVQGGFRYGAANTYKAVLLVTDAEGASVSSLITVKVVLDRPSADAGPDIAVAPGATVRLQGRGTDTLGRIVLREWKIGTGSFAPAPDSGTVTFTAPLTPGDVVCVFRVTDDDSLTAEDNLKVTVNDSKAPAVKSLTPADTVISIKDKAILLAKIEAADADLKSYALDVDGDGKPESQGVLAGKAQDLKLEYVFPTAGKFDITLKVEDLSGKTATAQARVTVLLDLPKADAGKDTAVPAGGRVNLHGKPSDSLGTIQQLEWKIGTGAYNLVSKGDTSFFAPISAVNLECVFRATDDDGQTVTDTMNVAVSASANADLSALALSAGSLSPVFAAGTLAYTASVPNATSSLTVTPTAGPGATIKVNGTAVASGAASGDITLGVGKTAITVDVTAQNGTTKKSYTVSVTRAASANADLSALALSAGTLSPVFDVGTTAYTASVPNATTSLTVTPTTGTAGAIIKVNNVAVASGTASGAITLIPGANAITIDVTAPDSSTKNTYTVTVTRAASTDTNLSGLVVSGVTLSPVFASATTAYTASVANSVTSVTATPTTAAGAGSTIQVNGVAVASGTASGTITLALGANTVTVVVTAQDGTTKKTYTVSVTRAGSANADLSTLALSAGTLSPVFAAATTAYTAAVPNATGSLTVTPTVAGTGATVKVNGVAVASGTASGGVTLIIGANVITIDVTAQDGTTKKSYTVTVTRASGTDATLSALVISGVTLSPAFTAANGTYTASVANTVASVTATPTAAGTGSTIVVNGVAVVSGTASGTINLAVGANAINVVVTAQDGTTKKTYTVTVTKAGSGNATLSLLAVGAGMSYGSFNSTTSTYEVSALYSAPSCRLIPTAADAGATIKVDGTTVNSGATSPALAFPIGMANHTIVVTAQDGVTTKTYTVLVWRDGPPSMVTGYASISSVTVSRTLDESDWASNPAGTIDFFRNGTGKYHVVFNGLATLGNAEGMVHVTPVGSTPAYCKVSDWTSTTNLSAGIACFSPSGTAMDVSFGVLVIFPRGSTYGDNAYVWADQASTASYNPNIGRSWNNLAGINGNTVTRSATGTYQVTLKGQGATPSDYGNFMLTAYGTSTTRCSVAGWGTSGANDMVASVSCKTPAGTAADEKFNLSFTKAYQTTDYGVATAYVYGSPIADTRGTYSVNNAGAAIAVNSGGTGVYNMSYGGVGNLGTGRTSIIQVTAYGSTNTTCQTDSWANFPDVLSVVYCFDNAGQAVDASFDVWVIK
jgi:hypothetical protein